MKLGLGLYLTLLLVVMYAACTDREKDREHPDHPAELLEGTLYFKSVNIFGPTGIPDSTFDQLMEATNTAETQANDKMISTLQHLRNEGLTRKPSFRIKTGSQKILTVFADEEEYDKIKEFSLDDLQENQKKVELGLKGKPVLNSFFDCQEITSIEVVPGSTPWKK